MGWPWLSRQSGHPLTGRSTFGSKACLHFKYLLGKSLDHTLCPRGYLMCACRETKTRLEKCTKPNQTPCNGGIFMLMCSYMLVSCTLTVVEESPKATAVQMIQDCQQEVLIKLKGCRKLRGEKMLLQFSDNIRHAIV